MPTELSGSIRYSVSEFYLSMPPFGPLTMLLMAMGYLFILYA